MVFKFQIYNILSVLNSKYRKIKSSKPIFIKLFRLQSGKKKPGQNPGFHLQQAVIVL